MTHFQFRKAQFVLAALTVSASVGGCGSPELSPTVQPTLMGIVEQNQIDATPSPAVDEPAEPCESGNLRIRDLPAMDVSREEGLTAAITKAVDWQQDSVLSSLSVACQLFESTFRWQATYYSLNAQAFFFSDTGEVEPSVFETQVPAMDTGILSFSLLHRALIEAGFTDDTVISPSSGVDVQLNSTTSPFGPPNAPKDVILYHVTIERLGEVQDLFVDARDGTIYRYRD